MSSFFGGGESQDVKLTEREQKLVAKLLSDPTYFPLEFRTWLKNYIEGAGLTVTLSQVRGTSGTRTGLPAGIGLLIAGAAAIPPDTIACDGAAHSRVTESALFAAIGTGWGAGDGSTTFNVPDLRDRGIYGVGAAIGVAQTDGHAFGTRGGWRHQHAGTIAHHASPPGVQGTLALEGSDTAANSSQPITVGPAGTNMEGPSYAGMIIVITNGKAA